MKKLLIPVLIILIIALGYVFFKQNETPIVQNEDDTTILSASFECKDGTIFTAEFPDETNVKIISNDEDKTFPRVVGEGKRFEDETAVYVFAGEEATFIDKTSGGRTTCEQPSDMFNAPVNFGDTGEGDGTDPDVAGIVSDNIIGKWQSASDTRFVREFKKDDTVEDYHDGKIISSGTWGAFSKEKPLSVDFPLEESAVYIQVVMSDAKSEKLNFKIGKLTPENLDLIYMTRGKTLSFTRAE